MNHRIELIKTHTHEGAVYQPGAIIELDEWTARWLIDRGIGRVANGAQKQAAPSKKRQSNV